MPLLRHGEVVEDPWTQLPDEAPVPDGAQVVVSLDRWRAARAELAARNAPVGLWLRSDQTPSEVAGDLARFGVVALEFPTFRDGRPFSSARMLRERYDYRGEVRAFGHILRDQFLFLDRCGVDTVEVRDARTARQWAEAMEERSVFYQPAADRRRPAMALRRDAGRAPAGKGRVPTDRAAAARARVRSLSHSYGHLPTQKLLAVMIRREFEGRIALVSSFGTEAAVLLHMVSGIDPATPVVFLDTRKLFGETLRYRDRLTARLGLTDVRTVRPNLDRAAELDADGMLWRRNADACCNLRKVEPLRRALAGFEAWITGRKRYQGERRAVLPVIEESAGRVKINPLASWTRDLVIEYFAEHDLPHHPLEPEYASIGCMPCTDRVAAGEGLRTGRWRGTDKTECGIHESRAGQSLTSSGL